MIKTRRLAFGAAILICVCALPLRAQTPAPQANAASVAADPDVMGAERLFSAWIEGQIAYRGLPGVAVGVVSNQDLVWSKGFGFADIKSKTPMSAKTKFRMASNSKLFTAIAIMQLREQGKLGLDDPVVKYLPWFKPKPAGDDDGPITIEQLLSHSSGCSARPEIIGSRISFRQKMNYNVCSPTAKRLFLPRCAGSTPISLTRSPGWWSRR